MLSFIFGKGTGVSTPQELSRRREIARALMERNAGQVPQTAWEGLNAVVEALGARLENNRLDAAEAAGRERATAKFRALFNDPANSAVVPSPGEGSVSTPRRSAGHPVTGVTPALADVYSDPWLSDEQRSITGSMWESSAGLPQRSAEGAVALQPPKEKPVVKPRVPRPDPSFRGIGVNPNGLGLTVDEYGNILRRP
jgi:hypothetical protein